MRRRRSMNWWFAGAGGILALTAAVLIATPSWLSRACNNAYDCGVVSPFLVGFVGVMLATGCLLVGVMRRTR